MNRFDFKYKLLIITVIVLFVWAVAADIPFSFKAGDVISAEQMNENFKALNDSKQERITGGCAAGSSIRIINEDGTVTCQVDNIGSGGSAGVDAINGMTGAVTLQAGDNISIDDSQAGQIRISAGSGDTNTNNHSHFGQTWTGESKDTPGLVVLNTADDSGGPTAIVGRVGPAGETLGLNAIGVWGEVSSGAGVAGSSVGGFGVYGFSAGNRGVYGRSDLGSGVHGEGDVGAGVLGTSEQSFGVSGQSVRNDGVLGMSGSGSHFGGRFQGGGGGIRATSDNESNPDLDLGGTVGIINGANLLLRSNGDVIIRLDQDNNSTNTFSIRNGTDTLIFSVAESGDAIMAGTLTQGSDRNSKHDVQAVNNLEILEKVIALPVTSWRYNASPEAQHIGPMAQDFYAVFGLGSTDQGIAMVDAHGISLAAIQGLYQLVQEQQAKIEALEARLTHTKP